MKILHTVESYLPSRHGMQEVVTQLSEKLVSMGHEVTVATSFNENRESNIINGVKVVDFKIKGNFVTGITGETGSYQEFLKSGNYDIVTNFAAQQWATDLMLPLLNKIKAKKVFVPTGFSALYVQAYNRYFERMRTWLKEYDWAIFLSDNYRDINFAKSNNISSYTIIPNGANEEEFQHAPFVDIKELTGIPPKNNFILSVGNHTGFKGHKAAMKIFSAARMDNTSLLIIGNKINNNIPVINFTKELTNLFGLKKTNCDIDCKLTAAKFNALNSQRSIIVKELSRVATINAFKQADLFLFPSLFECSPLVLFESLAGNTPFLVSDVGNAREIIDWTMGGKLLPTTFDKNGFSIVRIKESAQMLELLMENKQERDNLGKVGHAAVIKDFTWSKIALRYEKLYLDLLKKDIKNDHY